MGKDFQTFLNEGKHEEAERTRLEKINTVTLNVSESTLPSAQKTERNNSPRVFAEFLSTLTKNNLFPEM